MAAHANRWGVLVITNIKSRRARRHDLLTDVSRLLMIAVVIEAYVVFWAHGLTTGWIWRHGWNYCRRCKPYCSSQPLFSPEYGLLQANRRRARLQKGASMFLAQRYGTTFSLILW